jgi:HlyD family secretion protein
MRKRITWSAAVVFGILSVTSLARWMGTVPETRALAATYPAGPRQTAICGIGFVEPVTEIRKLVFKVNGVIASCPASLGQKLKKGDVLMTLDNDEERSTLAVAEQESAMAIAERDQLLAGIHPCRIKAAESKVSLLKEQLRYAQDHCERRRKLCNLQAASLEKPPSTPLMTAYAAKQRDLQTASLEELDQAETALVQAKTNLQQAEAELLHLQTFVRLEDKAVAETKVQLARARLESAQQRLGQTMLLAPFDGTVLEILKLEGKGGNIAEHEPVIVFADESHLRLRAEIDQRQVHQLQSGQKATVQGPALGASQIDGTIATVQPVSCKKTFFSRESTERKDLDILQLLVDSPVDFPAPLGLQLDADIAVPTEQ